MFCVSDADVIDGKGKEETVLRFIDFCVSDGGGGEGEQLVACYVYYKAD